MFRLPRNCAVNQAEIEIERQGSLHRVRLTLATERKCPKCLECVCSNLQAGTAKCTPPARAIKSGRALVPKCVRLLANSSGNVRQAECDRECPNVQTREGEDGRMFQEKEERQVVHKKTLECGRNLFRSDRERSV